MPDATTNTGNPTKADLEAENARLRAQVEKLGGNPDEILDENYGIVGNLADVQRLGANAVADGKTSVDDAIVPFKPESIVEASD
jgi:hypothetical protein